MLDNERVARSVMSVNDNAAMARNVSTDNVNCRVEPLNSGKVLGAILHLEVLAGDFDLVKLLKLKLGKVKGIVF